MRFYLSGLGCKVNFYELGALREALLAAGNRETRKIAEAELAIVNTCSVTATADQKSRQRVRRIRRLAPHAVIAVMGCWSELHVHEARQIGADVVIGTAHRSKLLSYVAAFLKDREPIIDVSSSVRHERYEELGPMAYETNARAYLKIQDGCDNFCAYCLIPTLRGNSRSRDPLAVRKEIRRMVERGYKEIVIAGIHIGGYGKDLGDGSYRLPDLLREAIDDNPGLPRLRVSSIEDTEISDAFLSLLRDKAAVCDHLHIPLQSGSSSVLRRMKRKYDTDFFLRKLKEIRSIRPDIAITTDVIAGFPGESDEEWKECLSFCEKARFAEIHVFPFSSRQGTAAAAMKDQIDPVRKQRRVQELLALSKKLRHEYEERFYGRNLSVLYEDYDAERKLAYGHSSNYLYVKSVSPVPLHGRIREVVYSRENAAD
ncbi:MAG: tRNA (N(6)-L-threonylcarbamoyladenosine(37)-C(2))-methylthiotransferase MtaB [Bacilli bacterium]|jgi:threonylcarbamoyladenosine tRNA methylthiotransferase MtaB|nr:tRNA (N(6)-L-threonylcarbamoyladenosine(37)-C(2))-methylthiotransferase MtaB [Bacilli bacterium]